MAVETEIYGPFTVTPVLEGFGAEVAGVPFDQVPLPEDMIKTVCCLPGTVTARVD